MRIPSFEMNSTISCHSLYIKNHNSQNLNKDLYFSSYVTFVPSSLHYDQHRHIREAVDNNKNSIYKKNGKRKLHVISLAIIWRGNWWWYVAAGWIVFYLSNTFSLVFLYIFLNRTTSSGMMSFGHAAPQSHPPLSLLCAFFLKSRTWCRQNRWFAQKKKTLELHGFKVRL